MAKPAAGVLWGEGLNTEEEMQLALEWAGAEAYKIHFLDALKDTQAFENLNILVIPGGFLNADDLGSARIAASRMKNAMFDELKEFVERDTLLLGVCNGFQALVKAGLLPYTNFRQTTTLTYNDSGKFEDRWVHLAADKNSPCVFTRGIRKMYLPVRHGEGKFCASNGVLRRIEEKNLAALKYADKKGMPTQEFPSNPNGSMHAIAGVCSPDGRVYGMMPHPEAYTSPYQHPHWTRLQHSGTLPREGDGMKIFRNAVEYFE